MQIDISLASARNLLHFSLEECLFLELAMDDRFETVWDNRTVWVNDESGCCIGRFSRFGVDVHKTGDEQMRSGSQCLDCIHDLPHPEAWDRFVSSMQRYHGVTIPEEAKPAFASSGAASSR